METPIEEAAPEHDPDMQWLKPENFVAPPKWRVDMKRLLDIVEYEGRHYTSFEIDRGIGFSVKGGDYFSMYGTFSHEKDIQKLKAVAEKAPYGKKEETVVDETVRKTWKIRPELVRVNHDMDDILTRVKTDLGVKNLDVEAKLHNVLLYEEGSFFKLHTDSEKEPGMFGTMSIQVNSVFSGGSLKIQHNGKASTIDLAKHKSCVTAWYTDCPHALEPVTSGVRVVLVYNLINKTSEKVSVERTDSPPDSTAFLTKMSPILDAWQASNETIAKDDSKDDASEIPDHAYRAFVYPLDHKYTMNGLAKKRYYEYDIELCAGKKGCVMIEGGPHNSSDESDSDNELDDSGKDPNKGSSGAGEDAKASAKRPAKSKDLQWEDALKGRDRNVVSLLKQCGMSVTICVQDIIKCTCSESQSEHLNESKCKIVRDGKLVNSEYQPRGYCGSALFVFSKQTNGWLGQQIMLGNLDKHYDCLAANELEPYTGNEGQDAYGWYRSTFLVVEPEENKSDRKRKAQD